MKRTLYLSLFVASLCSGDGDLTRSTTKTTTNATTPLHVVAYTTGRTTADWLECWLGWMQNMVAADRGHDYELHLRSAADRGPSSKPSANPRSAPSPPPPQFAKVYFLRRVLQKLGPYEKVLLTDLDVMPFGAFSKLPVDHEITWPDTRDHQSEQRAIVTSSKSHSHWQHSS